MAQVEAPLRTVPPCVRSVSQRRRQTGQHAAVLHGRRHRGYPTSTNISAADRKKYDAVTGQFDRFFKVRKNVIFERALFNRRCQGQSETAEQFITSLYSLAENCEYGELKDQMIRNRIIVGIRDQSQSARLQIDPELTLEKAKTLVRQCEAVQEQQSLLQHGQKVDKSIDSLHRTPQFRGKGSQRRRPPVTARQPQPSQGKCTRCGRGPHSRQQCPARDAECHTCKKKGGTIAHSASTSRLLM